MATQCACGHQLSRHRTVRRAVPGLGALLDANPDSDTGACVTCECPRFARIPGHRPRDIPTRKRLGTFFPLRTYE